MIPTTYYLGLSAILFVIGVSGVLLRRNAIIVFMSIELMLNSANLVFVSYARQFGELDGQILDFFDKTLDEAEVAVALALIVSIFRSKSTIDVDDVNMLKG